MRIILTALDRELLLAWQTYCGDLENVVIHHGSILEVACDVVVSPANSFGFMDGGIDLAYGEHFGWHVQERLQQLIRDYHHGELLVGAAEIVETDSADIPFIIAAPTMRVPMILERSVNPYLAARAVLLLVAHGEFRAGAKKGTPIRESVTTVAFPGLGAGVGRIPPEVCAWQVRAAVENVLLGQAFPRSWWEAAERHQQLYFESGRDLQLDDG